MPGLANSHLFYGFSILFIFSCPCQYIFCTYTSSNCTGLDKPFKGKRKNISHKRKRKKSNKNPNDKFRSCYLTNYLEAPCCTKPCD